MRDAFELQKTREPFPGKRTVSDRVQSYALFSERVFFGRFFVDRSVPRASYALLFPGFVLPERLEEDCMVNLFKSQTQGTRELTYSRPMLRLTALTSQGIGMDISYEEWKKGKFDPVSLKGMNIGVTDFHDFPPVHYTFFARWNPRDVTVPQEQMIQGTAAVPIQSMLLEWVINHHQHEEQLKKRGGINTLAEAKRLSQLLQ